MPTSENKIFLSASALMNNLLDILKYLKKKPDFFT